MSKKDLTNVYETVIRPGVEYSSVIYNSLIPNHLSDKLESVQRRTMRIIHGNDVDISNVIDGSVKTLNQRREENSLKFAKRAVVSERYGSKWFRPNKPDAMQVRSTTRNQYIELFYKNDREKNNPIYYMTRLLNKEAL